MRREIALVALTFVITGLAYAGVENPNNYDVRDKIGNEDDRQWQEADVAPPAFPKPENLVRVQAGTPSSHQYFIDATSVAVGPDQVVRYTAVMKTTGGAINTSFEGMRCETRERKVYAFGHADRQWTKSRDPRWRRIDRQEPAYLTLWQDYFCPNRFAPTKPAQAVEAIRRGRSLAHSNAMTNAGD